MTKYKLYLASSTEEAKGCNGYGLASLQMGRLADAIRDFILQSTDQIEVHRNATNFSQDQILWDANSSGIPNSNSGLFIELSSNYLGTVTTQVIATGCEVYWHKALNNYGQKIAETIYQDLGTVMGKKRCVEDTQLERKVKEFKHIEFPAALVYPLYHDNPNDVIRFRAVFDSVVRAISTSILRYWKIPISIHPISRPTIPKTLEDLIPLITTNATIWEEKFKLWKVTNPEDYTAMEVVVMKAFQLGVLYGKES